MATEDLEIQYRKQLAQTIKNLSGTVTILNETVNNLSNQVNGLTTSIRLIEKDLDNKSKETAESKETVTQLFSQNKTQDSLIAENSLNIALLKQRVYIISGLAAIIFSGIVSALKEFIT